MNQQRILRAAIIKSRRSQKRIHVVGADYDSVCVDLQGLERYAAGMEIELLDTWLVDVEGPGWRLRILLETPEPREERPYYY